MLCIRVRKGISRLDAHGAARVHRVGSCVGELAETGAVRAHGEYLAAVRVRAERIAPGAKDHRPDVRVESHKTSATIKASAAHGVSRPQSRAVADIHPRIGK